MHDPARVLAEGSAIIAPLLEPLGYVLLPMSTATGSGGPFAVGRWVSGDRFIETHVRGALGIVNYGCRSSKVSHVNYLRLVGQKGAYPGFSNDPVDGFRHLAIDLAGPVRSLLECSRREFEAIVESVAGLPARQLP